MATDSSDHDSGSITPGNVVRDLTERFQDIIDRISRLNKSDRNDTSNLVLQWISILEAGNAVTALPMHQAQAFADALRAQRDQVRALQSQLDAFDEQLTALEKALQPLLETGERWAQAQSTMLGRLRDVTRADQKDP